MSTWASLEPPSATVDPGSSTKVRLRIRNTSDVVEEYRITPVGDLAPYIRVEPDVMRLYPDSTGTAEVVLSPPRTPDVPAGPNPFALEITPAEHPDQVAVPEGNLTVTPFQEVRAELLPGSVRGRWRGRPYLAVDNVGNSTVNATLQGNEDKGDLRYDIRPNTVQVKPGKAAHIRMSLKPSRFLWAGRAQKHPYTVGVQRSGEKPVTASGEYVQPALLAGWLSKVLILLLMLALMFAVLWFSMRKSPMSNLSSKANTANANAVVTPTPTPTPTPSDKPSDPESPSAPMDIPTPDIPSNNPPPSHDNGGGNGGGSSDHSGDTKPKDKPSTKKKENKPKPDPWKKINLISRGNTYYIHATENDLPDGTLYYVSPWQKKYVSEQNFRIRRYNKEGQKDGPVSIENLKKPGTVMEKRPDQGSVQVYPAKGGEEGLKKGNLRKGQTWNLEKVAGAGGKYYRIVSRLTYECLADSSHIDPDKHMLIIVQAMVKQCNPDDLSQQWRIAPAKESDEG